MTFTESLANQAGVQTGDRVIFFKDEGDDGLDRYGPVREYASRQDFIDGRTATEHGWKRLSWAEEYARQVGAKVITF